MDIEELKSRILIDLRKFNESMSLIKGHSAAKKSAAEKPAAELDEKDEDTLKLAQQYFEDCKYFLGKGDFPTSFGCITYAHGLLDAILIRKELK